MTDKAKPRKRRPYTRPAYAYPDIALSYLHERCTEQDGCLIWQRQMKDGPLTTIGRKTWKVRHLVYRRANPRPFAKSWLPMPTVCGNERCVHPDHLTLVKRNSHIAGAKHPLLHCAHIAESKQAQAAKITREQAREIKASTDTLRVLAERYGISISNAHRIRSGAGWKDYSNPFAQLLGASL